MALSIKNRKLEESARELARLKGTSITLALLDCAERELRREKELRRLVPREDLRSRIQQIQSEFAALPGTGSQLSDDEVLGYDEHGIPSR